MLLLIKRYTIGNTEHKKCHPQRKKYATVTYLLLAILVCEHITTYVYNYSDTFYLVVVRDNFISP